MLMRSGNSFEDSFENCIDVHDNNNEYNISYGIWQGCNVQVALLNSLGLMHACVCIGSQISENAHLQYNQQARQQLAHRRALVTFALPAHCTAVCMQALLSIYQLTWAGATPENHVLPSLPVIITGPTPLDCPGLPIPGWKLVSTCAPSCPAYPSWIVRMVLKYIMPPVSPCRCNRYRKNAVFTEYNTSI